MPTWIGSVKQANEKIARLHKSTARAREKAGELMENVLLTTETVGTGFLFGFLEGRVENPDQFEIVKGVPYPLAVGVTAKLFSVLGVGRGMETHMNAVANGALTSHFNGVGRQMGKRVRTGEIENAYPVRGQVGPAKQGYGVSASDLERMIA